MIIFQRGIEIFDSTNQNTYAFELLDLYRNPEEKVFNKIKGKKSGFQLQFNPNDQDSNTNWKG